MEKDLEKVKLSEELEEVLKMSPEKIIEWAFKQAFDPDVWREGVRKDVEKATKFNNAFEKDASHVG